MWTLAFILLSASPADKPVQTSAAPSENPTIVIKGSKRVCSGARWTGSRVSRQTLCLSEAEAEQEAKVARDLIHDDMALQRVKETNQCAPPSIRVCN